MPKERIYGSQLPYGTPEDPGPARSVVDVCWSNEAEHVQVVTKCVDSQTGERFDQSPENATLINYTDGFYVDLDRRGINDLIRQLRKARDRAFGRDE